MTATFQIRYFGLIHRDPLNGAHHGRSLSRDKKSGRTCCAYKHVYEVVQAVLRDIAYSLSLSMMSDPRAFPVERPTPQQT
jgi:hypothetical protein